ncbi:MAG: hypothetical protein KGJ88_03630 [Verrucomicrobiota bacterium]|nr:hypothetical protein [Verrucomicrobiota bacterium]
MSDLKPEHEEVIIVLVGSFNPAIFHPVWFAHQKLIQQVEAERADIKIVSPDISMFSIGWLTVDVTQDRFAARTSQIQNLEPLRDLVRGTFGLLCHTPVKQMGINRIAHFRSASEDAWHQLGHRLAPKEPWAGLLEKPGMKRIQMQGVRPDDYKGRISVVVEPSVLVKPFGAYIEVNDHYDNDAEVKADECERMMKILAASWQISLERSVRIMQTLMKL